MGIVAQLAPRREQVQVTEVLDRYDRLCSTTPTYAYIFTPFVC